MSRSSAAQRPLTFLLTALLAAAALMLATLSFVPSATAAVEEVAQTEAPGTTGTVEDTAAVTEEPAPAEDPVPVEQPAQPDVPVEPAAVPPAEEFVVDYVGPECWDSSYNVSLEHGGDTTDLRAAVQEDVDGAWVTLSTVSFYDGLAFVYSDHLDEGVSATFRVVVYDRSAPAELTVVHGPMTVTGVSTDNCEELEVPTLPEDEWTLAESGCGAVTFTSRADEEVVVLWFGEELDEIVPEEHYFFLAPGESRTVGTTESFIYWVSAVGVDENLEPVGDEVVLAGEGEVEVRQDCTPAEPTEPAQPTEPEQPAQPAQPEQPAQPVGGGHTIPGKVQTDGGADLGTAAAGLLMVLAAAVGLVRRTV